MADLSPADGHLDEATWERLACGELTPFERDRALVHVTSCKACTAIHRALLALEEEAKTFDRDVPPSAAAAPADVPTLAWARWVLVAGLAAVVAFAVAVRPGVAPGGQTPLSPRNAMRAGSTAGAMTLLTPAEGGTLGAAGFSWSPVTQADAYRVQVNAADGRVIWESPVVSANTVSVPAAVMIPSGVYFWRVTASRAGETLATSPLSRFSVTP